MNNNEHVIMILSKVRDVLGTVHIVSTRENLDALLGCMQLCDAAISELSTELNTRKAESENHTNTE